MISRVGNAEAATWLQASHVFLTSRNSDRFGEGLAGVQGTQFAAWAHACRRRRMNPLNCMRQ